jgi:hypothetical protein
LGAVVAMAAGLLGVGCEPEVRVIRPSFEAWRAIADPPSGGQAKEGASVAPADFSIVVGRFTGPNRFSEAHALSEQLAGASPFDDAWVEDASGTATVYFGRYTAANSEAARSALKQIHSIEFDGQFPYAHAVIVSLTVEGRPALDPWDLRQFVGSLTLQIGFYDSQFDGDFRKAAEQAVRVLREEGHEAYYYHGEHRSLVTIGLFSESDFERAGNTEVYGPRIKDLQKKFPFNLGNGLTLHEKLNGRDLGEQPSFVVRVL